MKRIIDGVIDLPNGCETSRFPASFASVALRIEGITTDEQAGGFACDHRKPDGSCCGDCGTVTNLNKRHQRAHNLYAMVSGIALMQLDLSNDAHLVPWWGPNANRMLAAYDDYVDFTMGFAGYAYERYGRDADRSVVFEAIRRSIDADRPALLHIGGQCDWFPIIGYDDETGRLYGYDGSKGYWGASPDVEGDEDGAFYLGGWHDVMREAVIVTGQMPPRASYDDVFRRMIGLLETMNEAGHFKRSAEYLRDDANFAGYDPERYLRLARRIGDFIGMPIDQRPVVAWCFDDLARDASLRDRWPFFQRVSALYTNTHDVCWIAWRMVGEFGTAPADDCAKALASPIVRRAIADIIDIVRGNDAQALSCLRDMVG